MGICVECGKKLGFIEGYGHPTMGKNNLLCSHCFDMVFESVEKYREFISPYIGFFHAESSTTEDMRNIGVNITKNMKKMHVKVSNLRLHNIHQNPQETLSIIN